ncbi:MAG: hypothetical protein ATN33_03130 [Epulopiscium sp. Nele67-Bin001]|nr:MAG: hypothetical protein ATN33_03130 [Epulopiscium sp. Nele67-Bin001]
MIFRRGNSYYEKIGKNEEVCIDEELPFDIPDSWEWVRLGNVINLTSGQDLSADKYNDKEIGIPYLTGASNIENGVLIINRWTSNPRSKAYHGDLLLTCKGTVGTMAILNYDEVHIARQIMAISTNYNIHLLYIKFFLASSVEKLKASAKSMIPGIARDDVLNIYFPLPPLEEQQRIVNKIEELLPSIEDYNIAYTKIEKLNTDFPEKLKKSILQWAVQGKLVPQDENDEPASILLERIREEKAQLIKDKKIKKPKQESLIFKRGNSYYEKIDKNEEVCIDEELPFDIPDSWEWVRLGSIFQHNTGKALNSSNRTGQLLKYITTSNVYWDNIKLDKVKEMYFKDTEIAKCTITRGDLLVCEGGDVGRAAIWNYDYEMCIQNHIHRLRGYKPICSKFYLFTLWLYKQLGLIGGQGIGIKGLSSNALSILLLPVPPLEEQQRIVTKIEELLVLNAQL